jgi:hypothetical protein
MHINEIITNPPRDEYIDNYVYAFDNAPIVAKIKDLNLKKIDEPSEIQYGFFDDKNRLVGYMSLYYHGDNIWVVSLVQLAQAYKGMGYGTLLYDYAVMNDKLKIMSDATNTGGVHGSVHLWKRLKSNNRYEIVGYDIENKKIVPDATDEDVYNQKTNMRWLALPTKNSINETISAIQSTMKNRYLVWYGPGTSSEQYFNY